MTEREDPHDAPFVVVLNAGSGRHDSAATRALIETRLREAGRTHQLLLVEHGGQAPALARAAVQAACARGGIVVAAGGDGTVNTVAQALVDHGRGCRGFGVLPLGTFNYFARTHAIPTELPQALELLLTGRPRPVQLGRVNGRVFLVNASFGLYPELLEDRESTKARFGRSRLVALGAALKTLLRAHRQWRITVELEGRAVDLRTPTLFVCNNRLQLENIGIDEARSLATGRLAALVLHPVGALGMLVLALHALVGRLGEADDVHSFAFRTMRVRPSRLYRARRVKLATDGEVAWIAAPIEFEALPGALPLIVPDGAPSP